MSTSEEEGRLIGAVIVEINLVGQPWAAAFYSLVSSPTHLLQYSQSLAAVVRSGIGILRAMGTGWGCHTAGNGELGGAATLRATGTGWG